MTDVDPGPQRSDKRSSRRDSLQRTATGVESSRARSQFYGTFVMRLQTDRVRVPVLTVPITFARLRSMSDPNDEACGMLPILMCLSRLPMRACRVDCQGRIDAARPWDWFRRSDETCVRNEPDRTCRTLRQPATRILVAST